MTVDYYTRKAAAMAYVGVLNFVLSTLLAQLLKRYVSAPYDPALPRVVNYLRLASIVVAIVWCAYVTHQIMKRVPKPFASASFDPNKLKELRATVTTAFSYFLFLSADVQSYLPILRLFADTTS